MAGEAKARGRSAIVSSGGEKQEAASSIPPPAPATAPVGMTSLGNSVGVAPGGFLRRWILTTNHRALAIHYYCIALAAVLIGMMLSVLMRLHLAAPDALGIKPEDYLALVTMHGTLMVFFVLTVAPQSAFGNLVLAEQLGATRMALPRVNAIGTWLTWLALFVTAGAFLAPQGAPIGGWSAYAPLSILREAGPGQGAGMDIWLAGLALFCIASTCGAINTVTTVAKQRCAGMTLGRMPLTCWSWFVTAILTLLVFSVLLAAMALLTADRHFGTHFFLPSGLVVNGRALAGSGDGSPLLWQHLFWFFGHPEVYIAILPGLGLTSTLVSTFTQRAVTAYRTMVGTTLAIAFLGLIVWGHHMFVSGMNPYAGGAFALTTMAIALPSSIKVISWLHTLRHAARSGPLTSWNRTPMLFTLGFISFFIAGGLTGPILAQPALDSYLNNSYFVLAHFHLIMSMATVFGIFAATYYWFPLLTGRLMNERLGRLHFWLSLVLAYATFLPMHVAGLAGLPRHYAQMAGPSTPFAQLQPLQTFISYVAFLLASTQLLFLWNLIASIRHGTPSAENPWHAATLEWAPARWWQNTPRRVFHNAHRESAGDGGPRLPGQWEE